MSYVVSPTDDRLLEARFSWDGCISLHESVKKRLTKYLIQGIGYGMEELIKLEKQEPAVMHRDQLARLGRVAGQVEGIKKMIEEGRYCMDILIQLRAARAALKRVEGNILYAHLQHCVAQALGGKGAEEKVEELQRYFEADKS